MKTTALHGKAGRLMESNIFGKGTEESYEDYFVRLFEHKKEYGLNTVQIAELLNSVNGLDYGECAYRKEYAAFNRGRIYERKKNEDGVDERILFLSDFHYPYQLDAGVAAEYAGRVDTLVLNGDLVDMYSISSFDKTHRQNPIDEIVGCRQYIIDLINILHPARVIATYGNHEMRFKNYLAKHIDVDMLGFFPETPLDMIFTHGFRRYDNLSKTSVWYEPLETVYDEGVHIIYEGNWHGKIGRTIFAHPLSYSSGMLKTAQKAVEYFFRTDRDFDTVVMAHTHRLGSYIQGNIHIYEQGAFCKVDKMSYADGKLTLPQQKGMLYLCQDKDGNIMPDKTKLIEI